MTISSKLSLGCALVALAAGTAYADFTPNAQDSSGYAILDGSGHCVVTSGVVLPECEDKKPEPAPAPAAPAAPTPAAPTPAAPAAPAAAAPSSVRQSIVIQADALFDFDKYVV